MLEVASNLHWLPAKFENPSSCKTGNTENFASCALTDWEIWSAQQEKEMQAVVFVLLKLNMSMIAQ